MSANLPEPAVRKLIKPLLVLALSAAYGTTPAQTSGWPSRTVRVIVPFPAGGATDLVARAIAQRVSVSSGQQLVVDNKAGAGGTLGSAEAARAPADGYTLLLTTAESGRTAVHRRGRWTSGRRRFHHPGCYPAF